MSPWVPDDSRTLKRNIEIEFKKTLKQSASERQMRMLNTLADFNHPPDRDYFTSFARNHEDLLKRICIMIGNNGRFFLARVSTEFSKVTQARFGIASKQDRGEQNKGQVNATTIHEIQSVSTLYLCMEYGLRINEFVFAALAKGKQLNALHFLCLTFPGRKFTTALPAEYAAMNGHLEVLKYLVEVHEAPLNRDVGFRAAWKGHLHILQYLRTNTTCEWDRHACLEIAFKYEHKDICAYIHAQPWVAISWF